MKNIAIHSKTYKLYVVEHGENGESTARELTEEDIAQLSKMEQELVKTLKQQAQLMQELARMQEIAALEIEKIQDYCDAENVLLNEVKEWNKTGWGYKPKLHPAANAPYRQKPYWHRTRSFCVRKGYH
nr:MAG TPA: hypothetical protein [Caudoviricetes sp.]